MHGLLERSRKLGQKNQCDLIETQGAWARASRLKSTQTDLHRRPQGPGPPLSLRPRGGGSGDGGGLGGRLSEG
jgi:hypothetical protein